MTVISLPTAITPPRRTNHHERSTMAQQPVTAQIPGQKASRDQAPIGQPPWRATDADLAWWRTARLGMFVHFGVAAAVGVELSWGRDLPRPFDLDHLVQHPGEPAQRVPHAEYDNLFRSFDPVAFDPHKWVYAAQSAGAGYLVVTAKHHDGFCLWDTNYTGYKITSADSPFRRDIIGELAAACHGAGLRFGIYYSQRDWHHPAYLREGNREYQRYLDNQIRELLTNYGTVDVLWFDSYGQSDLLGDWDPAGTIRLARELQPHILINNRLAILEEYNAGPAEFWGDFDTPEQRIGSFQNTRPWESCITMAGNQWGHRPGAPVIPLRECVHALVRVAVGDGNLLLNIGPDATGAIDELQQRRLGELGQWLARYGHTVRGTRGAEVPGAGWGGLTAANDAFYVHVLDWPERGVHLPVPAGWNGTAEAVTGGTVLTAVRDGHVHIDVAAADRDSIDTIIKLGRDSMARRHEHGEAAGQPAAAPQQHTAQ
jgi:alpha-L-fucosidase